MRIRAARNIRRRPVQAEQNLAIGIGAGDVLNEFAGDVAGVQIWKNQDRRMTGNLAFRQFARGDFRDQRGVHLQFAIKIRLDLVFRGLLYRQCRRCLHATDGWMVRTAFRGKGE